MSSQERLEERLAGCERDIAYLLDMCGHLERAADDLRRAPEELQRQLDALHDWIADVAAGVA